MTKQSIYLTNNSQESLDELKALGYQICVCCKFVDAKWLHYFYREEDNAKEFHGVGYGCENNCQDQYSDKCIRCSIHQSLSSNQEVHIFHTVESLDKYIKSITKNYDKGRNIQ